MWIYVLLSERGSPVLRCPWFQGQVEGAPWLAQGAGTFHRLPNMVLVFRYIIYNLWRNIENYLYNFLFHRHPIRRIFHWDMILLIHSFFCLYLKHITSAQTSYVQISNFVVQFFSHVWLFETPWNTAHQASLSFTISQSLLKLMSIELMMPSNHLILCHLLLLLSSIFPSTRVFSNEWALRMGPLKNGFWKVPNWLWWLHRFMNCHFICVAKYVLILSLCDLNSQLILVVTQIYELLFYLFNINKFWILDLDDLDLILIPKFILNYSVCPLCQSHY